MRTKTAEITTSIRIQYYGASSIPVNTLGSMTTQRWTTDHLPKWIDEHEVPMRYGGEYVGTATGSESEDEFLKSCYAKHLARAPAGCNHSSCMTHAFRRADVPASLWPMMIGRAIPENTGVC